MTHTNGKAKEEYHLYSFVTRDKTLLLCRGRTQNDALKYLQLEYGITYIIGIAHSLPLNARQMYEKEHEPGWFYRKPKYYNKYSHLFFHP